MFVRFLFLCVFVVSSFTSAIASEDAICSPKSCYTLLEKLGEGAFGKVFAAENSEGQKFALKLYEDDEGLFNDIEREYDKGQLLDHPNIIKSIDYFIDSSQFDEFRGLLVLELVEGDTLSETSKGTLSKKEALSADLQLIDALFYGLSLDLLHMDLHEGNIMINKNGEVVVIDLASFLSRDEVKKIFRFVLEDQEESSSIASDTSYSELIRRQAEKIKNITSISASLTSLLKETSSEENPELDNAIVVAYMPYYFDEITDMCISIIEKSNFTKKEKVDLRLKIKKLAWDYSYEAEEGNSIPIEHYLESLTEVLQSEAA